MTRNSRGLFVLLALPAAIGFFSAGGCTSTSKESPATATATPGGPAVPTATNTRTPSPTPAVTDTPTTVPCTGGVPCNATAVSAVTVQPTSSAGATVSVTWSASGCSEMQWYGGTLDGFNFATGTVVGANATNDDVHIHLSAAAYGGIGYWHNPNTNTGMLDMGPVPLTDPSMQNPPDPASNTYVSCCSYQVRVDNAYFVRCTTGYARMKVICVDINSGTSVNGIRFQWDWGS